MGHRLDCGEELDERVVSDAQAPSGIVYERPACGAIAGVADATDI
jgi:hypothetical protein